MKAEEIRRAATRGGHNLGSFRPVPMGIGPVATCRCGLGVTQQRRGPGRGATIIWHINRQEHIASDQDGQAALQVALEQRCPAAAAFHVRLVHELVQLDQRMEATEIRQGLRVNIYRIGIYLEAAESCDQMVRAGATEADAFTEYFTPSRDMHRIAKALGLPLDVERGHWIVQTTQP